MGREGLDLSRTPPLIMMQDPTNRKALRAELFGIFEGDAKGGAVDHSTAVLTVKLDSVPLC